MADRASNIHGTVLNLKHIFGLNSDCAQDFELYDSKTVFYSAGTYLTKYSFEDSSQNYDHHNRMFTNITAICASPLKNFIAIARKGTKTQIQLIDPQYLRSKKTTMALSEEQSKLMPEFNYLAFSPNETRLAALSTGKDPVVSLWDIESSPQNIKLLATANFTGYDCKELAFCPTREDTFTLLGNDNFKMLRFSEDSIKIFVSGIVSRKDNPTDYVCHTWISIGGSLGIVVCTASKFIFVLKDNADIIHVIEENEGNGVQLDITCIAPTRDGFILGGEGLKVQKFRKLEAIDEFKALAAVRVNQNAQSGGAVSDFKGNCIKSVKLDADEDRFVCVTAARAVYTTMLTTDPSYIKMESDQINSNFSLAFDQSHSDKITFMDCSVRKPLLATCSSDKTVKVWDYVQEKLVHNLAFSEEVFAVSFHPSGFHIALAFTDKVQLVNLYLKNKDHQRNFKEFAIKSCRFLKFNHGGNLLAVASGDSPPEILIYRFYDLSTNPIHRFKGHTGIIKCFEWSPDDLSLYSCGLTGMIYKWSMRDGERKEINPKKTGVVNDMCVSFDTSISNANHSYSILLAVEDSESLREFNGMNNITRTEAGPVFGCVVKSAEKKMIFAGIRSNSKDGMVYFYRYPLSSKETDSKQAHNNLGVSRMIMTPRDQFLITAGMDGTIMKFELDDKEANKDNLFSEFKHPCPHILVTQGEITDLISEKALLNGQLSNESSQGAGSIDLTGATADNVNNSTNEFHKMKSNNEEKLENLRKEFKAKEEERKRQLEAEMETHKAKMKELEVYSTGNLGEKQDLIKILEKQMAENDKAFEAKKRNQNQIHNNEIERLENEFKQNKVKEEAERRQAEDNIAELKEKNKKELNQIILEASNEIQGLEKKYKDDENDLKNKQIKLKNEYQSNEKKMIKNRNKKNQLEEERIESKTRQDKITKQHEELKKVILALENKLRDKNVIITSSEKKIYDQKKRTGELEKFKYVLDFKIKELKKDMLPRDKEIQILKLETTKEDAELKSLNTTSNLLGEMVEKLQEEQKQLIKKIQKQKKDLIFKEAQIKKFKKDLYNSIQFIQNYPRLVEELKKMNTNPKTVNELDEDIDQEYKSQIKYLSQAAEKMKKNLQEEDKMHKNVIEEMMTENRKLIGNTKEQRDDNRNINPNNKLGKPTKTSGIKKIQMDYETSMNELKRIQEDLMDQISKLQTDISQLKEIKPLAREKLEKEELEKKKESKTSQDFYNN